MRPGWGRAGGARAAPPSPARRRPVGGSAGGAALLARAPLALADRPGEVGGTGLAGPAGEHGEVGNHLAQPRRQPARCRARRAMGSWSGWSKHRARVIASTRLISSASKPVEVGSGQGDQQVRLAIADAWALGHETASLEVAQHRLQRLGPRAAAMADIGGAGGDAVAGEQDCSIHVPKYAVEPLKPQRARILADPADILHQPLEPVAAEGVTAPKVGIGQLGGVVLGLHCGLPVDQPCVAVGAESAGGASRSTEPRTPTCQASHMMLPRPEFTRSTSRRTMAAASATSGGTPVLA